MSSAFATAKENVAPGAGPGERQRTCGSSQRWTLKDFDIGRSLGKGWLPPCDATPNVVHHCTGKFGNVYLAREKKSKFICALKVVSRPFRFALWLIVIGTGHVQVTACKGERRISTTT
jgi:hypothetical protein